MTPGGRYSAGLAIVALLGSLAIGMAPSDIRTELGFGIVLGLLVQAPLGWLTLRSIGTERFQLVWVLGMIGRMAVVVIAGLLLVPALGWDMVPALAALVATILGLLLLEVLTVMRDTSGIKAR